MSRPAVLIIGDAPVAHQNVFFDAVTRLNEVDLYVLYLRNIMPGRVWTGPRPSVTPYRMLWEASIGGFPTNPAVLPRVLVEHRHRLPFLIGYYLPGMLASGLALRAVRRPWVFWTDTLRAPGKQSEAPVVARMSAERARRWFLRSATMCISTGDVGREMLVRHGVQPDRAFSIPFVVDQQWIRTAVDNATTRRESVRREIGVGPDDKLLMFVGRLIRDKGIDTLLDALGRARSAGATKLRILLIGDGEQLPSLQAQANGAGLDGSVIFSSGRPNSELPDLWAAADVFVLPSRHDPWPVVVSEALVAGLPVLGSSACGSVRELVTADTGWHFTAENVGELADRLLQVERESRGELRARGRRARSSMERLAPAEMARYFSVLVDTALRLG